MADNINMPYITMVREKKSNIHNQDEVGHGPLNNTERVKGSQKKNEKRSIMDMDG